MPNARSRPSQLFLAIVAAGILSAYFPSAARSVDSGISATLAPPNIALTPGGSASTTLVISAGSAFAGSVVDVRAQPSVASVAVSPARASEMIQAGGSAALDFTVTRTAEGSGQDVPVTFVITPQAKPAQVVTATLDVKAAASPTLVEAKIESNVTTVDQNRPGEGALVITNPRESVMHVDALDVSAPANVDVTLMCPSGKPLKTGAGMTQKLTDCQLDIAPRSQAVLHFDLAPGNAVVPGPRSLLVKVHASGPDDTTQSVVATLPFTIDVFAESDILKSIGVPVFLLLPGVIIVLTAWFLIRWVSPWRKIASAAKIDSIGSVISATTVTAVVSLAVSLGVASVYPWLTRTFAPGYERDYLEAYGFQDFYYVIGYSFVIAVIVWLCALVLYLFAPLTRSLFIPTAEDEPSDLLRKIGLRGLFGGKAIFPSVTVAGAPALDLGSRAGGKAFVAPMIEVNVSENDESTRNSIQTDGANDRAFKLWRTVSRAEQDRGATLRYRVGDTGPKEVERSQVESKGTHVPIAQVPVR